MGEVYDLARTLLVSIENCMNESEYKRTASSYSEYNSNPVQHRALEAELGLASFQIGFPLAHQIVPTYHLSSRRGTSPAPSPTHQAEPPGSFSEVNENLAGSDT